MADTNPDMNPDMDNWRERSVAVFGLVFWNRAMVRNLLPQSGTDISFHRKFEEALAVARHKNGCILGWASRLTKQDRMRAQDADIPLLNMEDGFVRSVGLGAGFVPATSLVIDQRGIYYDPTRPSDLEDLLQNYDVTDAEAKRGEQVRRQICALRVSKYNLGGHGKAPFPDGVRKKILVPGQVSDDAAIRRTQSQSLDLGNGDNPNLLLIKKVRRDNPDAFILFKQHPDVMAGLRKGYVSDAQALTYCDALAGEGDILDLIDACDQVETISSLTGFEALLRDKDVTIHGQPFYAGWGLTKDHSPVERRTRSRTLNELVFLTLIAYSSYVHPVTGKICEAEEAIAGLAHLRQSRKYRWRRQLGLVAGRIAEHFGL